MFMQVIDYKFTHLLSCKYLIQYSTEAILFAVIFTLIANDFCIVRIIMGRKLMSHSTPITNTNSKILHFFNRGTNCAITVRVICRRLFITYFKLNAFRHERQKTIKVQKFRSNFF